MVPMSLSTNGWDRGTRRERRLMKKQRVEVKINPKTREKFLVIQLTDSTRRLLVPGKKK
jgi:hypothetical protein